jgi:hypothetical protein
MSGRWGWRVLPRFRKMLWRLLALSLVASGTRLGLVTGKCSYAVLSVERGRWGQPQYFGEDFFCHVGYERQTRKVLARKSLPMLPRNGAQKNLSSYPKNQNAPSICERRFYTQRLNPTSWVPIARSRTHKSTLRKHPNKCDSVQYGRLPSGDSHSGSFTQVSWSRRS